MRQKLWRTPLVAVVLLPLTSPALGSLGGPDIAEIIGYSARDQRLYYSVTGQNAAVEAPSIFYLDLGSKTPGLPILFPDPPTAIRRNTFDSEAFGAAIEAQIDSLRSAVDTLARLDAANLNLDTQTLSTSYYGESSRYRRQLQHVLRVELDYGTLRGATFVSAFCNKDVGVTEVLAVPGHPLVVANLYYTGIPYETCYRRHELVLLWPEGMQSR